LEQIVLYLAVLVALSGFGMGLINLAGPLLKRRSFALPSLKLATLLRRGAQIEDEDDFDLDLDTEEDLLAARDFAESSFAPEKTLLARRRSVALEDDEEELVEVLEEAAEEGDEDDDDIEDDDEGPVIYTVSAEAIGATEDETQPEEEDELSANEDEDGEDEEDEDGEDEEEGAQPEVITVAAGGGESDDMMSFFGESADAGAGAIAAWREDLPEVDIAELLAEARAIRQQIQGQKSNAA